MVSPTVLPQFRLRSALCYRMEKEREMAYDELSNRFTGVRKTREQHLQPIEGQQHFALKDEAVERLIDEAGRSKVFQRAEDLGWSVDSPPPRWVWIGIAQEIIAGRSERKAR